MTLNSISPPRLVPNPKKPDDDVVLGTAAAERVPPNMDVDVVFGATAVGRVPPNIDDVLLGAGVAESVPPNNEFGCCIAAVVLTLGFTVIENVL